MNKYLAIALIQSLTPLILGVFLMAKGRSKIIGNVENYKPGLLLVVFSCILGYSSFGQIDEYKKTDLHKSMHLIASNIETSKGKKINELTEVIGATYDGDRSSGSLLVSYRLHLSSNDVDKALAESQLSEMIDQFHSHIRQAHFFVPGVVNVTYRYILKDDVIIISKRNLD